MGKLAGVMTKVPWPIRILLAVGCLYLMLRISVSLMIDELTDVASEVMDIEYGDSYFNWKGHFGVEDVAVTLYDREGQPSARYEMDRAVVRPSTPLWLLRNSFFSPSKFLPDEIGVTLEGLRNSADTDTTPGNYTNLPYDAMGCTEYLLTPREIQAMGAKDVRRDLHVQIERVSLQSVNVAYTLDTPGLGKLDLATDVEMQWPVRIKSVMKKLDEAPVRSASLTFTDQGFIGLRNAACARQHGLAPEAFQAYHLQEVRRRLSEENLSYGEAALQQYATFANKGEQLVIRSAGPADLTFGEFVGLNFLQKMQAFPLQIAASSANPSPMQVTWGGPGPKSRAAVASAPVPTAGPAVVPAANVAAATAQPVAMQRPEAGSEVPYEQAGSLVGEHIEVSSRLGTLRRGILRGYLPQVLKLELDPEEGGFMLTIYSEDVASIRYTPVATEAN